MIEKIRLSRAVAGTRERPYRPYRRLLTAGSALLAFWWTGLSPQAGHGQENTAPVHQEILVEALDSTGAVITDQVVPGLEVVEDGRGLQIEALGQVGSAWRIVLYFDQLLASPADFHNATIQLGERARDLTRLGSVELLVAGQEVSTALPANREPDSVSQALGISIPQTWLGRSIFSPRSR